MKAQFIVTIEGSWVAPGNRMATPRIAAQMLRNACKEEFEFLADKWTVTPVSAQVANKPALTETPTQEAKP